MPTSYASLVRALYKVDNKTLQGMPAAVEKGMQNMLYRLGQETRDRARAKAPKRTGALRASIYVTRPGASPDGGPATAVTRQSTVGYFRAANAAVVRNKRLRLLDLGSFGPGEATHSTQTIHTGEVESARATHIGTRQVYTHFAPAEYLSNAGDRTVHGPYQTVLPFQSGGRNAFFVSVGASVYYAGFVEFGAPSRGVAPQPFLGPAVDWARSVLPERAKQVVQAAASGAQK